MQRQEGSMATKTPSPVSRCMPLILISGVRERCISVEFQASQDYTATESSEVKSVGYSSRGLIPSTT